MEKFLKANYIFPAIFIFSFLVYLAHTAFTKTSIFGDSRFYYSITRSIVKDHDIKFTNDYPYLGMKPEFTNGDYVWNMYPPGAPILWIPLFTQADAITKIINIIPGVNIDDSGFNNLYQSSAALTNIFLGTLGLYLLYSLLQKYFSERVSLFTTLLFFGATNLLFYIAVEPINSHAASFFISMVFLYYFLKHEKDHWYYLILGFLGGIAGLIRTQDAAILILPMIKLGTPLLKSLITNHQSRITIPDAAFRHLPTTTCYLQLTTGFLIGFFPQLIYWKLIFNSFYYSPYFNGGFDFLHAHIVYVLFNTQNGLFIMTPIILISLLGLFFLSKKLDYLKYYSIIYFLLQLILISAWVSYAQAGSYSIRMIITTYPLIAFGLAAIINKSMKIINENKIFLIVFLFSLVNVFSIIRYLLTY